MAFGYQVLGFGAGGSKPPYDADYLVVSGGGTGWHCSHMPSSGAGGAGGLRTSYAGGSGGGASPQSVRTLTPGTVYTATVGGTSTFTGADIADIETVNGGRGGGYYDTAPGALGTGGSGGGTSPRGNTAGLGTANEGYDGETPSPGCGGGAGEVAATDGAGYGGDGVQSAIDGTPTYYAGGGGSKGNPGGDGGGGAPGTSGVGTVNTGGGGGASLDTDYNAGGSGIVIIRVPTAKYSGTVTGSPTVTTDGKDTVIKFTATGTYTA